MTNIDNAITDIARRLIADHPDRPITQTESQLRARIDAYCDDPETTEGDKMLIFARLAFICD